MNFFVTFYNSPVNSFYLILYLYFLILYTPLVEINFQLTRQACQNKVYHHHHHHITDNIKQELAQSKIDPVIVPGGCTKYIQAPDVAWNKLFKAKITEKYDA